MNALEHEAQRIAGFIVKHYQPAQSWEDPVSYCAWFISHGFMTRVETDDGEIYAVAAARPVERPGLGVLPFYFNEQGTCLHVDLLIDLSEDKHSILIIRDICRLRFPQCETVTLFRHCEEHIRVYPLDKLLRGLGMIWSMKKEKQHELVEH